MEICRLAPGQQVRALVVDDVLENRKVLSAMLGMAGCDSTVAENGRQAIQAVRELRPDIVFMDMRLPGLDGSGTARLILNDPSAPAGPHRRHVGVGARRRTGALPGRGCDEFVAKPFRAEQIYGCVAGLLNVEFVRDASRRQPAAPSSADLGAHRAAREPRRAHEQRGGAAQRHRRSKACLDELEGGGPTASSRRASARLSGQLRHGSAFSGSSAQVSVASAAGS